jgi:hypothetical protein
LLMATAAATCAALTSCGLGTNINEPGAPGEEFGLRPIGIILLGAGLVAVVAAFAPVVSRRARDRRAESDKQRGPTYSRYDVLHAPIKALERDSAQENGERRAESLRDDPDELVLTEWHYAPITVREAEVIAAEMAARAAAKRKKPRKRAKAPSAAGEATGDEARDTLRFIRDYEKLARLVPEQNPPLPPGERDQRIARRTSTTSGEVGRLRRLRNDIAHDRPYSIKEVRAGSRRVEVLLRNAAGRGKTSR